MNIIFLPYDEAKCKKTTQLQSVCFLLKTMIVLKTRVAKIWNRRRFFQKTCYSDIRSFVYLRGQIHLLLVVSETFKNNVEDFGFCLSSTHFWCHFVVELMSFKLHSFLFLKKRIKWVISGEIFWVCDKKQRDFLQKKTQNFSKQQTSTSTILYNQCNQVGWKEINK